MRPRFVEMDPEAYPGRLEVHPDDEAALRAALILDAQGGRSLVNDWWQSAKTPFEHRAVTCFASPSRSRSTSSPLPTSSA
jgi:hypothetical protein